MVTEHDSGGPPKSLDDAQSGRNKAYAWYVLLMMMALYAFNYADRYVASGLAEAIKQTYDIPDTILTFLIGPAFAIFFLTAAIPIARYADNHSRVKIIATGAVVWSVFAMLSGYATTPALFAAARIGVGIGEAAFLAPCYSLLSDYFPPRRRSFAFAFITLGVYLGQIGGQVGGSMLADIWDWRTAFVIIGAPGVFLGILTWLTVREPERGRFEENYQASSGPGFFEAFGILWQRPLVRHILLGSALGGFGGFAFGILGPTFFLRAFDLTLTEANTRFGLAFAPTGLLGALLCGWLCDKLAPRDPAWPLRIGAIAVAGSAVIIIAACFAPNVNIATMLAIPAGLLGGGWSVTAISTLQDNVDSKLRATVASLWSFCTVLAGLVLGVQFAGWLSDMLAPAYGDASLRISLAVAMLACIPSGILFWRGSKMVRRDKDMQLAKETA